MGRDCPEPGSIFALYPRGAGTTFPIRLLKSFPEVRPDSRSANQTNISERCCRGKNDIQNSTPERLSRGMAQHLQLPSTKYLWTDFPVACQTSEKQERSTKRAEVAFCISIWLHLDYIHPHNTISFAFLLSLCLVHCQFSRPALLCFVLGFTLFYFLILFSILFMYVCACAPVRVYVCVDKKLMLVVILTWHIISSFERGFLRSIAYNTIWASHPRDPPVSKPEITDVCQSTCLYMRADNLFSYSHACTTSSSLDHLTSSLYSFIFLLIRLPKNISRSDFKVSKFCHLWPETCWGYLIALIFH